MPPTKRRRQTKPKPKRRFHRMAPEDREDMIVNMAMRYFSEVGLHGQTRELSRRIGITQPLLYRYFPSKCALIDRVYAELGAGHRQLQWERRMADRRRPIRDRLIQFYDQYSGPFMRPESVRLLMHAALAGADVHHRHVDQVEQRMLRSMVHELRHAIGLPDADTRPISDAEMEFVWTLHGAVVQRGMRKFIYRMRVPGARRDAISLAVDMALESAPRLLMRERDVRTDTPGV